MTSEQQQRYDIIKISAGSTEPVLVDQWTVRKLIDERNFLLLLLNTELQNAWNEGALAMLEALEVSATSESAEKYLRSQGLDPDKISKDGMEKIHAIMKRNKNS